jgi:hypothetical protein
MMNENKPLGLLYQMGSLPRALITESIPVMHEVPDLPIFLEKDAESTFHLAARESSKIRHIHHPNQLRLIISAPVLSTLDSSKKSSHTQEIISTPVLEIFGSSEKSSERSQTRP